jgi:hypothetical protein
MGEVCYMLGKSREIKMTGKYMKGENVGVYN